MSGQIGGGSPQKTPGSSSDNFIEKWIIFAITSLIASGAVSLLFEEADLVAIPVSIFAGCVAGSLAVMVHKGTLSELF